MIDDPIVEADVSDKIKVFFCAPTGEATYTARAWRHSGNESCDGSGQIDQGRHRLEDRPEFPPGKAPCTKCGEALTVSSQSQNEIYRRSDTGEEVGGDAPLPAGAVWAGNPAYDYPKGPDGRALWCKLPDGHTWGIDGRASNCTMPADNIHRCWVRHGRPEDGTLHVDKNGHTCNAGAGSIATKNWHGFLHDGHLVRC